MRPIIRKLLHEFWLAKGKFILCVVATATAGWGVSTVTYSYLMAERDFHENYTSTESADFALTIQNFDDRILDKLRSDDQVSDIERREMLTGRIRNNKDVWMTLILFAAVDLDDQRMDKFRVTDLNPELEGFILIEQNANDFLDYASDTAVLQFLPSTAEVKLPKGGIVHDARQAPAQMERLVYGYTLISTVDSLLVPGQVRLLFKTKDVDPDRASMEAVTNRLKNVVAENGGIVTGVLIPEPGKHTHQPIVDGISFLQQSFGSVLAVLGITLLSLILLTWLFPQLTQVGIMKAIGASTRQIYSAFVSVLLMIIFLGLAIGLPLGFQSAALFNKFIAFIQNFEVIKQPFSISTHALVILVSALFPFLFAMAPIVRVARVTVREAFSTTFRTASPRFMRYIQTLAFTARGRYGASNLFRSGMRTLLLVSLLTVGIALFFTGTNLQYSFREDFTNYYRASRYEISINMTDTTSRDLSFLNTLPFVESTSFVRTLRLSYTVPDNGRLQSASLRIYPVGHDVDPRLIIEGELDRTCTDCLWVSPFSYESGFTKSKIGDTITFTGRNGDVTYYRYAGVIKDLGGAHGGGTVYHFSTSKNPWYSQVAVKVKDGVDLPVALNGLEESLKKNEVKYAGLTDVETLLSGAVNHFKPTYYIVQGMGLFTIVVAFIGMLMVVNLTIQERTLEIGIMKALGSKSSQIANVMMMEFTTVNALSITAGFALGWGLTYFLCDMYGEMVRGQAIPPLNNYVVIVSTAAFLLVMQALLVSNYCRYKIKQTANALLNYVV